MKLTNTLVVLAMAFGFAACGPDGGQMTAAGGAGAGGTGGRAPDAGTMTVAARVLGTWRYTAGQMNCTCDDGSVVSDAVDGTETETFSAGLKADQVVATDADGCALTCDVYNNTVACHAATCQYEGARATISSDVYSLVGNELNEVSLAEVAIDGGPTCQCTQTGGVLVRAQ